MRPYDPFDRGARPDARDEAVLDALARAGRVRRAARDLASAGEPQVTEEPEEHVRLAADGEATTRILSAGPYRFVAADTTLRQIAGPPGVSVVRGSELLPLDTDGIELAVADTFDFVDAAGARWTAG